MPAHTKKQRLLDDLLSKIDRGVYPPGGKLPSGAELCDEYGVSMMTVRSVMEWLKATGRVKAVPGSGVYVAERSG